MSLTGNLEDLPLLDILQIVSFSKKTGHLTIRASEGEGAIVFKDGLVVSSFTWESLPVDPRVVTLPPDRRASLIKNRIVMALERLTRLREGQFNFALSEDIPKTIGARDISLEVLPSGINPQEMLLDLARGLDEDRRDSSAALEASFAQPEGDAFGDTFEDPVEETGDTVVAEFLRGDAGAPETEEEELKDAGTLELEPAQEGSAPAPEPLPDSLPTPAPPPPAAAARPAATAPEPPPPPTAPEPPPRTVLLVDDEEDVRGIIAGLFGMVGYEVIEAEDPESAVKAAHKLNKAGTRFLLLVDLGMPDSGGSSFYGGFEVVKRLVKMNLRPPVLMMTESLKPALQARARQMGISSFVFKPGLSKLDRKQFEADLRAFATKLVQDVIPSLGRADSSRKKKADRVAGSEEPPAAPVGIPPSAADLTRELGLLQQHLAELRKQTDPTQVAVMVMRVAREFFERGVILLVKNDELRGLGGFGMVPKDQKIGLIVRDVMIPLKEPSVFRDVVDGQKPFLGPVPDGKAARALIGKVGRFKAGSAVLLPLLTNRETIAVLYGDNPESGVTPGRLETLELFINQAGIALENAFLQRKLRTTQA
jgi:CheY-like chemotaxis protein